MAHIFISYASSDSVFALRLATHIKLLGHAVWIDQWEIGVGDFMAGKIAEGINQVDYIIAVLSPRSVMSGWVERELQIAYCEEITRRRTIILPVIIEDCVIPAFLRPKRFADFRVGYEIGFAQLAITLHAHNTSHQTHSYYSDTLLTEVLSFPASLYRDFCYTGCMIKNTPQLSEINVEIGIPYIGRITGMWKPDEKEQHAAWELYIELVTRVSVAGLQPNEGLLHESLSSLYEIFKKTREILREHGPSIARPKGDNEISFGYLAIHVLNFVLRPVLATWHPLLKDYEHTKEPTVSDFKHEAQWERAEELRRVLNDTRLVLLEYTNLLAQVAGVPQLIEQQQEQAGEHPL